MSKYSSFKSHQLITENWRNYLSEEDEKPQPEEVVASAKKILASPKGHKAIAKLLKDPEFRKQMDQSLGQEISEGAPEEFSDAVATVKGFLKADGPEHEAMAIDYKAYPKQRMIDQSIAIKVYRKLAADGNEDAAKVLSLSVDRGKDSPSAFSELGADLSTQFSPERLQTSIKNLTGEDLYMPVMTAMGLGHAAGTILGGAPALLGAGAALAAIALYRQWKKEDLEPQDRN
jgi:hypothetical protein